MGYMTLPAWFVRRTFLEHVGMTGSAVLSARRDDKSFKGTVTLVTFDHGDTMQRVVPLLGDQVLLLQLFEI